MSCRKRHACRQIICMIFIEYTLIKAFVYKTETSNCFSINASPTSASPIPNYYAGTTTVQAQTP